MTVILHNVRSLYNIGSIFRTADAVGMERIYLSGITPGPIDRFGKFKPQFTKVSLGAEHSVKWEKIKTASTLIDCLKKEGYKVFAVEQSKKSILYYKVKPLGRARGKNKNKIVLIFGNEVRGLPLAILEKCDEILEIPMRGKIIRQARHPRHLRCGKESLNIGVAFAVVAFHLLYSYD